MTRKNIILILLFFSVSQLGYSQNYEAEYSEFGSFNEGRATLLFNAKTWLYKMTYQQESSMSSDDVYIDDEEAEKYNIKLFNYYSIDDNKLLWQLPAVTEKIIVEDSLSALNWTICSDSTSMIGGHLCIFAQCDLCGWTVNAWFSPEIPVPCGPWRLWGLPGLIMKAYTDNGDIDIQLTSLKQTDDAPYKPKLEGSRVIAKSSYVNLVRSNAEKFSRMLSNMQEDRDVATDFSVSVKNTDNCFK